MKKKEQRLTKSPNNAREQPDNVDKKREEFNLPDVSSADDSDFEGPSQRFGAPEQNEYYAKVSGRYRTAKLLLTALLVLVIVTALVFASDSVTYANLKYLMRNLGDASASDTVRASVIPIEADGKIACGFFSGRFAVAGESAVVLRRIGGKQVYRETLTSTMPVLTLGKKYFLVWTCGENTYTVFNSVAAVKSGKLDTPIYAAATADDGSYALLTATAEYRSVVELYDADFSLRAAYRKSEGYVSAISLSADASRLALFSFRTENGAYTSCLDVYLTEKADLLLSVSFADGVPLACGFFSDGSFWCFSEKSLRIYGADGSLAACHLMPGEVRRIAADESFAAVLCHADGADRRTYILAYKADGSACAEALLTGSYDSLVLCGSGAAVLGEELTLLSFEDGGRKTAERKTGAVGLAADGSCVYCIYGDRAELVFGETDS